MRSIAQWSLDRPRKLQRYEDQTHPRFVSKYAGEKLCFEDIYHILHSQAPGGWRLEPGDVLLDLGCGTGWYARRLSIDNRCRDARIFGLDLSENALRVACQKQSLVQSIATVTYYQADITKEIPIKDAREIWLCGALHQAGDPSNVLSRVSHALADDGVLHIQTYCVNSQVNQQIDIVVMKLFGHHIFKHNEIDSLAHGNGLETAERVQKGMVELCTMRHI